MTKRADRRLSERCAVSVAVLRLSRIPDLRGHQDGEPDKSTVWFGYPGGVGPYKLTEKEPRLPAWHQHRAPTTITKITTTKDII